MKPWIATIRYKSRIGDDGEGGLGITNEFALDDPGELDILIRQGPGWGSLLWVHLRRSDEAMFPAIDFEDLQVHENLSVIDGLR